MFRRVVLLVAVFLFSTLLLAQRAIPDNNLAYPVWISLSNCLGNIVSAQGSGFFLNTGSELYLVTARHVLYTEPQAAKPDAKPPVSAKPPELLCKIAELRSYSKEPKEKQQNRMVLNLEILDKAGKAKPHPGHDVAVVQIATVDKTPKPAVPATPSGPTSTGAATPSGSARPSSQTQTVGLTTGVFGIQNAPSGLLGAEMDTIKKFDEVLTANEIYVFGYPSSIGLQQAPQIDYNAPLLRKGIISGVNSANETIVLDAMTFHGNSGGPVLELVHQGFATHFFIIGVVSQYVPVTEQWVNTTQSYYNMQLYNSGYSIAEPMDPVLELVGK